MGSAGCVPAKGFLLERTSTASATQLTREAAAASADCFGPVRP